MKQRHPWAAESRSGTLRHWRVAEQIEAGMVFVNCVGAEGAELPLGGIKRSGFGRELDRFGIEEFLNRKLVRVGT